MNIGNAQAPSFRPGASSFRPGAPSYQPAYPQYQQYGGYNQQYPQYGYGYNQQGQAQAQGQQPYQQYGYNQQYQQYSGYNQQQQQPTYNQSQSQQAAPPVTIAKRPAGSEGAEGTQGQTSGTAPNATGDPSAVAPKAKVLSIGLDATAKVEKTGQTKVLSISSTTTKADAPKKAPEAGSKAAAVKAIEKTGEPVAPASGKDSPAPSSGKNSPSRAEGKAPTKEADAVAKEQEADVDESILNEVYGKVSNIAPYPYNFTHSTCRSTSTSFS